MKTYKFVYNNNQSRHGFECDEDAMKAAVIELQLIRKYDENVTVVHVFEQQPNEKYRWIGTEILK